jgi:hypothetical protein
MTAHTQTQISLPVKAGWALSLFITAATVLCLALAAQYTLSSLAGFADREAGAFVIEVHGEEGAHSEAGRNELWVERLIVDGQLVRGESLERANKWEVISRGSGLPAHLLYKSDSGPASLTLQGKSLFAI